MVINHPFRLTILIVLGVVLALYQITSDDTAYADTPFHSLEISLFPAELTAEPSESKLGVVTFGGNVTVEKPQAIAQVTVSMSSECGRGWPAVQSPQTMEFINPGTQRFQVTVIVPPGTLVSSASVMVYAHAESTIWEADESASATVRVGQFIKMDVWTDADKYDTGDGRTVIGKLFINNSGNGEDSFRVEMENDPSAISGFAVNEGVTAPPFTMLEVTFTVHISEDFDVPFEGEFITVNIKVTSIMAESMDTPVSKTHPIIINVQGLQKSLEEDWPMYIVYGVVGTLAVVGVVRIVRRRRGKGEDESSVVVEKV